MTLTPPTEARIELTGDETFHLAFTLHRSGHLPEAEGLYRRLLEAMPDHVDTLHFLGVLCHQGGRNEEAESLISRIVELQPSNADARNNLGNVLQEQGRFAEAETAYRKAIGLRPEHAPAWNNLAVVVSAQKRYTEAVAAARRAVELAPEDADHQYNLANALRRAGHLKEAVQGYRRALSLQPRHERARHGLGRALVLDGRRDEAVEVFREWLRVEPGNPTAAHLLAALAGEGVPDRASDEYVKSLFDDLSGTFDSHLSGLGYQAPSLVADAIARELPQASGNLDVLDAGCGTGLCAPLLRPYARKLTGVDLSGGMLQRAATLGLYDGLAQAELGVFLGQAGKSYDLIASADTLCYFGRLDEILSSFSRALRPGGLLVFTLEDSGDEADPQGFKLDIHGRYSHGRDHVLRALEAAGFSSSSVLGAPLRLEAGQPVAGLVLTARKAS